MAQITIRKLPDEVHRALKAKARREGQSAEALARKVLQDSLLPAQRARPGDMLRSIWQGVDLEGVTFEDSQSLIDGASFE